MSKKGKTYAMLLKESELVLLSMGEVPEFIRWYAKQLLGGEIND